MEVFKNKKDFQSKRQTSIYLRTIKIAIRESLNQAEAQIMFHQETKANGIYEKGKGHNQQKEGTFIGAPLHSDTK